MEPLTHFTGKNSYISYSYQLCDAPTGCAIDMSDEPVRGERLQIMLTSTELDALNDFRFKYRMPSRAAAIRELLKLGLAAHAHEAATRAKSRDFGVLDTERDPPSARDAPRGSSVDEE